MTYPDLTRSLDDKVENEQVDKVLREAISRYAANVANRLIKELNASDEGTLQHIVDNEFTKSVRRDRGAMGSLTKDPRYVYAAEVMRGKAVEFGSGFITSYWAHIKKQGFFVRLAKSPDAQSAIQYVSSFAASYFTVLYSKSIFLAVAAFFLVFKLGDAAGSFITKLADRKANYEVKMFEKAVKAEFYNTLRNA